MGHLIENPVGRCTTIAHVQANDPCTWISVSDVNQATDFSLDGDDLREIGVALAMHAAHLSQRHDVDRLERVRRIARLLGVDAPEYLRLP